MDAPLVEPFDTVADAFLLELAAGSTLDEGWAVIALAGLLFREDMCRSCSIENDSRRRETGLERTRDGGDGG